MINFKGGLIREGNTYYATNTIQSISPALPNKEHNRTIVKFVNGDTFMAKEVPAQWADAYCYAEKENGKVWII